MKNRKSKYLTVIEPIEDRLHEVKVELSNEWQKRKITNFPKAKQVEAALEGLDRNYSNITAIYEERNQLKNLLLINQLS